LLAGLAGWADASAAQAGSPWSAVTYPLAIMMSLAVLAYAFGIGLNLATGRLLPRQSSGAVDDGASCAVLLEMCQRLAAGQVPLVRTAVTVALFCGEEVTMQGSRAYVRSRHWPLPAYSLNLEGLGQDGDYILWQADGTVLGRLPTDPALNAAVSACVEAASLRRVCLGDRCNSDTDSFLRAGIPSTCLGSLDSRLGMTGLHGPADNPRRIVPERLQEAARDLERLLCYVDSTPDWRDRAGLR
jgi:Zn-dependent M28 family amino/carboxypeptidase